jgi:hypothetical protein
LGLHSTARLLVIASRADFAIADGTVRQSLFAQQVGSTLGVFRLLIAFLQGNQAIDAD